MLIRTRWLSGAGLLGLLLVPTPAAAAPCDTSYNNFNGPQNLYLNVHNCGLACWLQEVPYLELVKDGVTGIRIAPVTLDNTAAPDPGFYTVNSFDPYFEDVFAIFGPERTLVLIDDGVDSGPFAKPTANQILRKLSSLLARHPKVRHVELMNEPLNFSNITPEEYVGRYLRPARILVDEYNTDRAPANKILLYSAAWIGNADGVRRARRMVRAGGLAYVDVMSVHLYETRAADAAKRAREYKRLARGKPIAVTETNFNRTSNSDYAAHPWWICESMTEIERVMLQGLSPDEQRLQANVFYTLRGDSPRFFNLINFADSKSLNWTSTGPGHFILIERSKVPTDGKGRAADPDSDESTGGEEDSGDEPARRRPRDGG